MIGARISKSAEHHSWMEKEGMEDFLAQSSIQMAIIDHHCGQGRNHKSALLNIPSPVSLSTVHLLRVQWEINGSDVTITYGHIGRPVSVQQILVTQLGRQEGFLSI